MVIKGIQLIAASFLLLTFAVSGVVTALMPCDGIQRRRVRIYFTHLLAKALIKVIRVKVEFKKSAHFAGSGKLVVANHVSVLDAIVLMARAPSVFVTSTEIEEQPLIGFLARSGGCLFVERRNRLRIEEDQTQLRKVLLQGFDIVLFPEGTSTNGTEIKRFKSGLFPAALELRASIEPVSIRYESISGAAVSESNRDRIFYYGDHLMHRHLFNLFTNGPVKVCVQSHPLVSTSPSLDPKLVAQECRNLIVYSFELNRSANPNHSVL